MDTTKTTAPLPSPDATMSLSEELTRLALYCPDRGIVRGELLAAAAFSCLRGDMTEAVDPAPIIAIYDRLAASSAGWRQTQHAFVLQHLAMAIDEAKDSVTRFSSQPLNDAARLS